MRHIILAFLLLAASTSWAEPLVIAHRGGRLNWPENTLSAFEQAQALGVDMIELDVQVTKDGIPVLYHPADLSEWTTSAGSVSEKTWEDIRRLEPKKPGFEISRLSEVFERIKKTPLILDMKSLPARPLVEALIKTVPAEEWKRITVYSTNKDHLILFRELKPDVVLFEVRATTRGRLLAFLAEGQCRFPSDAKWIAFELKRKMTVVEKLTLGDDSSEAEFRLWSPESIRCVRKMAPKAKLVFIGINTKEELRQASGLGADAVYSDDPKALLSGPSSKP
jgi:glycerophosphoryl diester phosphodiesterase